jgi:CRP-like cAMP-binding protein
MTRAQVNALIKELTIERHPTKQELFSVGDIGKKFYIILQGTVLILIPQDFKVKDNGLSFI